MVDKKLLEEKEKIQKAQNPILRNGLYLLLVSILFGTFFFFFGKRTVKPKATIKIAVTTITPTPTGGIYLVNWEVYHDADYNFSIIVPRLLNKTEVDTNGLYLKFVMLNRNYFSLGEGVAVGVRKDDLNTEVIKIKNEISNESVKAKLTKEEKIVINGYDVDLLYYDPTNPNEGESKIIAIINANGYSYSISSVPSQIDTIVNSFKIVTNTPTPEDIPTSMVATESANSHGNCGETGIPCPKGFKCEVASNNVSTCVKE